MVRLNELSPFLFAAIVSLLTIPALATPVCTTFVSNSAYSAGRCDEFGTKLFITGASGTEYFNFGIHVDVLGEMFVNDYGQLVGAGEATADGFAFYAVYGYGGFSGGQWWGYGVQPNSVANGIFGNLGWIPNENAWVEMVSFGNDGIATARVDFVSPQAHAQYPGPNYFTWTIGTRDPAVVPEPATLVLCSTGLALIALRKRNRGTAVKPD